MRLFAFAKAYGCVHLSVNGNEIDISLCLIQEITQFCGRGLPGKGTLAVCESGMRFG